MSRILKDSFLAANAKKRADLIQLANFIPPRYFGLRFGSYLFNFFVFNNSKCYYCSHYYYLLNLEGQ